MSDCNFLGNPDSVRQGNLDFQTAPRWFCDQPGMSSSAPAGLTPRCCGQMFQLLCMDDSYSPSNGGVGTTSPHFADEETGAWISTERCRQWTPQPLYSLPCITEPSFDANLATLGMWYVSQASPATSYKSSSHFCMSKTLPPYLHYFTLIWPDSSPALPHILPLSHSPIGPLDFEWAKGE